MSDNKYPLVTVFTLVYKTNPKFVIEAIESIYNQTYPNIEHIVVNDAPDDKECWPVIKQYITEKQLPSIIIEHEVNYGITKSLNQIVKLATGEFIIGCCDDVLEVDSIINMINHFQSLYDEYKIVFGDISFIDENSNIILNSYFEHRRINPEVEEINFSTYLRNTKRFPTFGAMYRLNVFNEIGLYDETLIAEDVDMHLRILNKYKCSYCGNKVGRYRRHPTQLSQNNKFWFVHDRIKIYLKWVNKTNGVDKLFIIKSLEKIALNSFYNGNEKNVIELKSVRSLKITLLNILILFKIPPKTLDYWLNFKNSLYIKFTQILNFKTS